MPTPYHPPVKRSVEIAGHKTSISLEPLFWDMLHNAAAASICIEAGRTASARHLAGKLFGGGAAARLIMTQLRVTHSE